MQDYICDPSTNDSDYNIASLCFDCLTKLIFLLKDVNVNIMNSLTLRKINSNEITNDQNVKKDKISKYEIGDILGKGAYAIVKIVRNKITNMKFAMKIYEKQNLNSNSKKTCVLREIHILKK